jgi:23S rRNA pseudouridine2457 synthase
MSDFRYFALHKPFGMLSQFIGGHRGLRMLGDLPYEFPEGIHAIGRLDYESEGLLLLTTDSSVTRRLYRPEAVHPRTYLVNVYRKPSEETLQQLRAGVQLVIKGGEDYVTTPALVERVPRPDWLPRGGAELAANIEQDWLEITLTEGKYRQVRKMLAAVRHKCRRLVRLQIGGMKLEGLKAGELREYSADAFFGELGI